MSDTQKSLLHRMAPPVGILFTGFLVYVGILLFEEFVTADMRWGLWMGGVVLFALSVALGSRGLHAWAPVLLAAPLVVLHGMPLALDLPLGRPFPVFWLVSALAGWLAARGPRWVSTAAPVALAAMFLYYGGWVLPRSMADAFNDFLNEPAPSFALQTLDGKPYPMRSLAGKVVVLDFFATWCIPCRAELPEIEDVRQALADRDDIVILVVGDGDSGDTREQVAAFAEAADLDLPFVWDPDGVAHDAFEFPNIPALAVIDRKGNVRLKRVGFNAAETGFESMLTELLLSL